MEQNATDGDAEVVITDVGGNEGLSQLTITDPDEKQIITYSVPETSTLGIREFNFESPEPELEAVKEAYPEGIYTFEATTFAG